VYSVITAFTSGQGVVLSKPGLKISVSLSQQGTPGTIHLRDH
jgi:hypothetical protein